MRVLFLTLVLFSLVCGCLGGGINSGSPGFTLVDSASPMDLCVDLCGDALGGGRDLSSGPCLSEHILDDWACDVAHSPREAVDDLPENQCASFRDGVARHFVEVDVGCSVLRVY
jgi:hypothetical protein